MPKNKPQPQYKRILFVCQHYWPETFRINDISEYFAEKNCRVDVLCGLPNYPSGKIKPGYGLFKNRRQLHNGVNIERVLEIPRGNNSNFRIFINYISFPLFSLFHIPRLLLRKYDKVYVFTYSPIFMSIAGILVGKLKRVEITMSVLDLWPENLFSVLPIKSSVLRWTLTKVSHWHYRQADKFIVPSERMGDRIRDIIKTDDRKIIVLPQACEKIYEVDIKDVALQKKFAKGFNILFTGNISPAQSFETILQAAIIVRDKGMSNVNWIIVGDGMSKNWLMKEVKRLGLESDFYFEGQKPIEDIPRYTSFADVLIGCLVKSELLEASIPAKVTSYLAAGRPMVMAIDGEARDLINIHAKSGHAGPTQDAESFANNLLKIYKLAPAEREKMGRRGREYHFKHLERNLIMNKMYDFILD